METARTLTLPRLRRFRTWMVEWPLFWSRAQVEVVTATVDLQSVVSARCAFMSMQGMVRFCLSLTHACGRSSRFVGCPLPC